MKVVELIKRLEELGYNENTKICFGFYDYGGECVSANIAFDKIMDKLEEITL